MTIFRNVSASSSLAGIALILLYGHGTTGLAQNAGNTRSAASREERNLVVQQVAAAPANKAQRVALVIGNAAYRDAPLSNPVNDARAIAQALQESGFNVILRENTDQRGMLSALREFGDRLRGGGTGLFYYAGHGMQIKGRNYLIPIGANVEREDEVAYSAVDAQAVLDKMEAAANAANIMILDACRNNPFLRSSRNSQGGLAQMDAPVGTLVAFATSPGAVASDGTGTHGLYTQHLLNAVRQPGSKVEDVFKQVRANVRRDSNGKQVPWEATSLEGDFYFKPLPMQAATTHTTATGQASAVSTGAAVEAALWEAVKTSELPIELKAYLGRYPQGTYAALARNRLMQLESRLSSTAQLVKPAGVEVGASNRAEEDEQAALQRRTDELLASLASPSSTASVAATKPQSPSSASGFTVGDRWRYQVVDKYKGEVVSNFSYNVDSILPNGDMSWNKGALITSPEGNFRRDVNNVYERRDYTKQSDWVPKELRVGYTQDVNFVSTVRRRADNFEFTEEYKGSLTVKGKEKIKVPAGEFEAYRIERVTDFTGIQTNGNARWYGRSTMIGWFVPELRNFAARDHEHRVGTQAPSRERVELTSYSVRDAQKLAAR